MRSCDLGEFCSEGRIYFAEGREEGVNYGMGKDFFGGSKSGEEWDDSTKTDNFRYSAN